MPVHLQRVYDDQPVRGAAVLVDRVWPRGIRRESLGSARWLRELGPSDELRRWFGHRPERWDEFQRRYRAELQEPERRALVEELASQARAGPLTLLFGARDRQRNQAAVLAEVIAERLRR